MAQVVCIPAQEYLVVGRTDALTWSGGVLCGDHSTTRWPICGRQLYQRAIGAPFYKTRIIGHRPAC